MRLNEITNPPVDVAALKQELAAKQVEYQRRAVTVINTPIA